MFVLNGHQTMSISSSLFCSVSSQNIILQLKKTALDTMKNRQLDSEIRIKGYLAVIACPCGKSANEIKTLLESEPVHQGM